MSSANFLAADVLGSWLHPRFGGQYSMAYNSISELLTPDSPYQSRWAVTALMFVSNILGMLFGFGGIMRAASSWKKFQPRYQSSSRCLYRGGLLLGSAAFCNLISATAFPQDIRGEQSTIAGTMHLVLVGVSVVLSLPAMFHLSAALRHEIFQKCTYLRNNIASICRRHMFAVCRKGWTAWCS